MTTIRDVPEEVLRMIFENLDYKDRLYCQTVCRSWYMPAHIAFLHKVVIHSSSHSEQFMTSIDFNPNPLYLNAVKEIKVFDSHLEEYSIKKDQFQTMNFRFSNLVKIHASLTWFRKLDDELAEKFLECCPRFDEFNTNYHTIICSSLQYHTGLYRIRHIASHLQLKRDIFGTPFGEDVIQYLINFPRLKSIFMEGSGLNNFQTILQVVHRLSRLTSISMRGAEKDKEHFAEKFLRTKTAEERRQIVKRLSKVKELTWYMSDGFCSNSIMFASKYLTGLNSILMGCSVRENWNNTEQRLFCNKFIDLAASSTNICNARLSMNFMMLSKYLPTAMHRLFSNESTNLKIASKRKLILSILKEGSTADPTHILVDTSKSITSMDVRVSDTRGFEDFVSQIFKKLTPIHYFKSFDLNFTGKSTYNCKVDVDSYYKLIEGVGSVKKLALDIPVSFKEGSKADYDYSEEFLGDIYPMVEDMTLRATPGVPFDTLLDRYAHTFPNMKRLHLHYFCGTWSTTSRESRVKLSQYSLEKLGIDITPVDIKMKKHRMTERFFVIEVAVLKHSERHLYKVSFIGDPFSQLSITKIEDKGLKSFARGKDYCWVHINIESLNQLELYWFASENAFHRKKREDVPYLAASLEFVTKQITIPNASE